MESITCEGHAYHVEWRGPFLKKEKAMTITTGSWPKALVGAKKLGSKKRRSAAKVPKPKGGGRAKGPRMPLGKIGK